MKVCKQNVCISGDIRWEKVVQKSLELKLKIARGHHVGAENQIFAIFKNISLWAFCTSPWTTFKDISSPICIYSQYTAILIANRVSKVDKLFNIHVEIQWTIIAK